MCVCTSMHVCVLMRKWEREKEREIQTRYSSSVPHRLLPLDCSVEESGSIELWMEVSSFDDVNIRLCILKSFRKDINYIVHIKVVKMSHRVKFNNQARLKNELWCSRWTKIEYLTWPMRNLLCLDSIPLT